MQASLGASYQELEKDSTARDEGQVVLAQVSENIYYHCWVVVVMPREFEEF